MKRGRGLLILAIVAAVAVGVAGVYAFKLAKAQTTLFHRFTTCAYFLRLIVLNPTCDNLQHSLFTRDKINRRAKLADHQRDTPLFIVSEHSNSRAMILNFTPNNLPIRQANGSDHKTPPALIDNFGVRNIKRHLAPRALTYAAPERLRHHAPRHVLLKSSSLHRP